MKKAFVTGSTGLLGNNLVRLLVEQGYDVKALARSRPKAEHLFSDLPVTVVLGDMQDVNNFASELDGCDVLFHMAAFFRDYYQPGNHDPADRSRATRGEEGHLREFEQCDWCQAWECAG